MLTENSNQSNSAISKAIKVGAFLAASLPSMAALENYTFADEGGSVATARELKTSIVEVSSGQEFLSKWGQGDQFFVKGAVGLKDDELNWISAFLAEHPNWTVFLNAKAESEEYNGKNGFEALDNLIEAELVKTVRFAERIVGESVEPNSAILLITFDQNLKHGKVAYYSSKAQDLADVGYENWAGKLDQLAIAPLKNSKNVVAAVKAVIATVDQAVTDKQNSFINMDSNVSQAHQVTNQNGVESSNGSFFAFGSILFGAAVVTGAGLFYLTLRGAKRDNRSDYEPPSSRSGSRVLSPTGSGGSSRSYASARASATSNSRNRSSESSRSNSESIDNSLSNYLIMDSMLNNNSSQSSTPPPAPSNDCSSGGSSSSWDSGSSFGGGFDCGSCGGADSSW